MENNDIDEKTNQTGSISENPVENIPPSSPAKSVKHPGLKIAVTAVAVVAAAGAASVFGGAKYYDDKFLPNTYMNGTEISGMTRDEAKAAVLSAIPGDSITFTQRVGEPAVFGGELFESMYDLPDDAFSQADSENKFLWFKKFLESTSYECEPVYSYDEEAARKMIEEYEWGYEAPVDAQISYDGKGNFSIVPENDGAVVDTAKLADYASNCIKNGDKEISLEDSGCYGKANVTSADLTDKLKYFQSVASSDISFDMTNREAEIDPTGREVLDHSVTAEWISVKDNELVMDEEKAKEWVKTNIAGKYDTLVTGYSRPFQTTLDGVINLPIGETGTYGWKTNVNLTADRLVETLLKGKSAEITPVYRVSGFEMHNDSRTYSGKTYIEISLSRQHLWYYADGVLYLESDVVTGLKKDPERATKPGRFLVWGKQSPRVLGTYEVQGYEAPVQYWMPVDYTGVGLHDLYHRKYGGKVYEYEGSHGCINLPKNVAGSIYAKVTIGTPVMITP